MIGFREFFTLLGNDNQIVDDYLNGSISIKEIAKKFNKTESQIYRILHSKGVEPNRLKTNHQKVNILNKLGWNNKEIASLTNYSTRNVRNILKKGQYGN